MKSGGKLHAHMHEKGWLSGSIYINVPTKTKPESGNLVVSIEEPSIKSEPSTRQSIDVRTESVLVSSLTLALHNTF